MASSRDSQNGPDWKDVVQAIQNYEVYWNGRTEIVLIAEPGMKTGDFIVTARVLRESEEHQGPIVLASASVSARREGYRAMEALLMKALFDLDVAMYRGDPSTVL